MSLYSTFRTLARLRIPEISSTDALSDANFLILTNAGQREFIKRIDGYPTSTVFPSVASQATYSLNTQVPNYLAPRRMGCWYQASSTATRQQLDGWSLERLGKEIPGWRSASSGTPRYVIIEGNDLLVHPAPSAAYASGLELYHFAQATDITADAQYLFTASASTELKYLIPYEDILLDYLKMCVKEMIGKPGESAEKLQLFYSRCLEAKPEIHRRDDMKSSYRPRVAVRMDRAQESY